MTMTLMFIKQLEKYLAQNVLWEVFSFIIIVPYLTVTRTSGVGPPFWVCNLCSHTGPVLRKAPYVA